MFYFLFSLRGKLQASLLKMTLSDTELLGAVLVYSPLRDLKMKVHKQRERRSFETVNREHGISESTDHLCGDILEFGVLVAMSKLSD